MSAPGKRVIWVAGTAVLVCVLIGLYIGFYLTTSPGDASASAVRTPVGTQLYLATVAASELSDPHPTWVSYYQTDARDQNWHHATTYELPRNSLVHVTIYQFDGQSGLRNPFIAQATGVIGGSFELNGKPTRTIDPDAASHIFAIPQMGVSVPLAGIPDSAKNPCDNAPCPLSTDHETISFTIRTPGPGLYRWQCFVPCAAGYIDGFGGPMQSVGYMDGFIKVV
ncbi:MAG TPA: hypothetical protein VGI87_07975 [Solirubrobacteraceae bacterium]